MGGRERKGENAKKHEFVCVCVCVCVCVTERERERHTHTHTELKKERPTEPRNKTNEKKSQENLSTCGGWVRMRNEDKRKIVQEVCSF